MKLIDSFNFVQNERDNFVQQFASSLPAGITVLDVGAGTCPYKHLFKHCKYITHDFCQLDPGLQRSGEEYGKIDVVSDILSIPLETASIDVIICTEVLEHVPEPTLAIHEMSRLLKSGGQIIITTPLCSFLHQQPYHYFGGFTPFYYELVLNNAGFANIDIAFNQRYFSYFVFDIFRFIKMALKLPIWWLIILIPFILLILPLAVLLFVSRKILDKLDSTNQYTFALKVKAIKK